MYKILSIVIILSTCNILNADKFDKPSYENQVNSVTKSKLNNFFKNIENQSVVTDKNIIYYRPEQIKRRKAHKFVIWSRADVISFERGEFYYVIPEGYRLIIEKEGEIFIDYEPTQEEENLIIQ